MIFLRRTNLITYQLIFTGKYLSCCDGSNFEHGHDNENQYHQIIQNRFDMLEELVGNDSAKFAFVSSGRDILKIQIQQWYNVVHCVR